MKKNMNSADRAMRLLLAAALFFAYPFRMLTGRGSAGSLVLARILLFTGLPGYCPLYARLGDHKEK